VTLSAWSSQRPWRWVIPRIRTPSVPGVTRWLPSAWRAAAARRWPVCSWRWWREWPPERWVRGRERRWATEAALSDWNSCLRRKTAFRCTSATATNRRPPLPTPAASFLPRPLPSGPWTWLVLVVAGRVDQSSKISAKYTIKCRTQHVLLSPWRRYVRSAIKQRMKDVNRTVANNKICSARHSKRTRLGIGTLWSVLEVTRTMRWSCRRNKTISAFCVLDVDVLPFKSKCNGAIERPSRNILIFIWSKSDHFAWLTDWRTDHGTADKPTKNIENVWET